MKTSRYAAVDCGSNSLRMVLVDDTGRVLDRRMTTTRLGRSIPSAGRIDEESSNVVVETLANFAATLVEAEVAAVATSAVRDAGNGAEFISAASSALGAPLEVITGQEEGRLSFAGATLLSTSGAAVVIDVGGGSTEICVGAPPAAPVVNSVQAGCVRLTEMYLNTAVLTSAQLAQARSATSSLLAAAPSSAEAQTVIAVGGTATTLGAYDLRLPQYRPGAVEGHILSVGRLDDMTAELAAMSLAERKLIQWLAPERAEVIVAGALILREALVRMGLTGCSVSEHGILEGILYDRFDLRIEGAS